MIINLIKKRIKCLACNIAHDNNHYYFYTDPTSEMMVKHLIGDYLPIDELKFEELSMLARFHQWNVTITYE